MIVGSLISASIVGYTHTNQRESASIAASAIMERSAEILRLKVEALIRPIETIADLSSAWPDISVAPTEDGHPMLNRFMALLKLHSQISALNIGFQDGSFYMVRAAAAQSAEKLVELSAPAETMFIEQILLRDESGEAQVSRNFLNENGEIIFSVAARKAEYDPRTRPWYTAAWEGESVTRSQVYLFSGSGKPGMTISRRHARGVVGVDFTLRQLKEFLSGEPQAKNGLLAIFSADGTILATTASADENAVLTTLIDHVQSQPFFQAGTLDIQGIPWLAHVAKAPLGADSNEIIALALPLAVITEPIAKLSRNTMLVSLLIVLASMPFIWMVSRGLSKPLIRLAADADRIRHFDLRPMDGTKSKVIEVHQLQSAMARMKTSLRTFSLYVPKSLVKKLIERDEMPELGGQRRFITVLFMDLENFTAMSADLEPEEVMRRMSAYFEVVTQTLLAHGATIDKYIGDAVMAFWNAPDDTDDHTVLACRAALAIQQAALVETAKWAVPGTQALRTRIGLHCGQAIVGNVGSSDRMSYTALGTTVNLAARLEAANREMGTSILVSQEMAHTNAGLFEFRSAGTVDLKGFSDPVEVFELLSELSAKDTPEAGREPESVT